MKTLDLTNRQVSVVLQALRKLDGAYETIEIKLPDGSPSKISTSRPYKFAGKDRLLLAMWAAELAYAEDTLRIAHNGLVKQYASPDAPDRVAPENDGKYRVEWESVLDMKVDFFHAPVSPEALNLDENPIPISVLSDLAPILVF